ncbi:hypothetical protein Pelo_2810 [Pelomyxa schiedti]|nr:hypothetical protein Pelo_2810 [Pelomyxa schiedti]
MDPTSAATETTVSCSSSSAGVTNSASATSPTPIMTELLVGGTGGSQVKMFVKESTLRRIPYFEKAIWGNLATPRNAAGIPVFESMNEKHLAAVFMYAEREKPSPRFLLCGLSRTSSAEDLVRLLDFLCLLPTVPNLETLDSMLKDLTSEFEDIYEWHKANKKGARDAAALLVITLCLHGFDFNHGPSKNKAYSMVEFVIHHPGTFGCRLRHHTFEVAKATMPLTTKQIGILANLQRKWRNVPSDDERFFYRGEHEDLSRSSSSDENPFDRDSYSDE